ncbi:MAG: C-GCAxxG-C-C family protein [Anaeromyxobacteraceae bacterium]
MSNELSRRNLLAKAGLTLAGAMTLGSLSACGEDSEKKTDTTPVDPGPQVADFPYEQHLPSTYQLDAAAVREVAYHGYYAGGCCHGAYAALLGHLADTVGKPFSLMPKDFGKFGGGGIASYGSICGAALGGTLIINSIVANADARNAMMTELLRWYEGYAFPAYVPTAVDAAETGTTKNFTAAGIVQLQRAPNSHLCHASVSDWCAANGVSAGGADKKARCARLTADVAGKVAEMLNTYLAGAGTWTAPARDAQSATCVTCHPATSTVQPVASGMKCGTCHADKTTGHP